MAVIWLQLSKEKGDRGQLLEEITALTQQLQELRAQYDAVVAERESEQQAVEEMKVSPRVCSSAGDVILT